MRRVAVAALAGAAALAAAPGASGGTAAAAVSVRIIGLGVVDAATREPARPPYRRDRPYAYVVRYRIAGAPLMRVTRRAELRTPGGTLISRVAPPAAIEEPGAYFATARVAVGRRDPRTTYVLRYVVAVRARGKGADRAERVVRLRFV